MEHTSLSGNSENCFASGQVCAVRGSFVLCTLHGRFCCQRNHILCSSGSWFAELCSAALIFPESLCNWGVGRLGEEGWGSLGLFFLGGRWCGLSGNGELEWIMEEHFKMNRIKDQNAIVRSSNLFSWTLMYSLTFHWLYHSTSLFAHYIQTVSLCDGGIFQ